MANNQTPRGGDPGGAPESTWIDADYQHALERVAASAGLPSEDLQRRIEVSNRRRIFTPDCLTLEDVELYGTFAKLPPARQAHVRRCPTCLELLTVIEPTAAEGDWFVSEVRAASAEAAPAMRLRDRFVWQSALAGAAACLMAAVPLVRYVDRPETTPPSIAETPAPAPPPNASVETFIQDVYAVVTPERLMVAAQQASSALEPGEITANAEKAATAELATLDQIDTEAPVQPEEVSLIVSTDQTEAVKGYLKENGATNVETQPIPRGALLALSLYYRTRASKACDDTAGALQQMQPSLFAMSA